jgi:2-oxoglutarate dehydrogenase E2 component (dihydrolipoamide succinyltransferase)
MANEIEVLVPSVGESVSEGSIGRWFRKDGDIVKKDEPLFELDSDKASMEVPANESGKLKILVAEGEVVKVGSAVARIDTSAAGSQAAQKASSKTTSSKATSKESPKEASGKTPSPEASEKASASVEAPKPKAVDEAKIRQFTPSQRKAIRHGKLEPAAAKPSLGTGSSAELRKPMSALRKTIAQRLLHSQHSTATLTTFNEVDMSRLMSVRKNVQEKFQKDFGTKLGFMSFFSKACIEALKNYPLVNAHIDGDEIVEATGVHLGVAVSTERGLVVPVMRNAERLSYAEIELQIAALAEKARAGKLSIPDMQGGSFTITNGGIFGSLLSTPILNPPQSGILGMHKVEHRPMAIQREDGGFDVQVRPMMYVALSYDHRLIDGATSVGFLVKVKEYLESVTEDLIFA